jgi:DNA-binding phage protein
MSEHDINPACIEREAKKAAELEKEIQEMRHEREQQIAQTNRNVDKLSSALVVLTKDVSELVGDEKTQRERMDNQDKLIAQGARQMDLVLDWQKAELLRHTREEVEKKVAIEKVAADAVSTATTLEQQRKDRIRPVMETVWKVIQWAAILALGSILNAVWIQYFRK